MPATSAEFNADPSLGDVVGGIADKVEALQAELLRQIGTSEQVAAKLANLPDLFIPRGALTSADFVDGLVDGDAIRQDAIDTVHLIENAVTDAIIGPNAVNATHIGAAVIGAAHIGVAAIRTAAIRNLAVVSAKIASVDAGLINAGTINVALTLNAATINGGAINIGSDAFNVDGTGRMWMGQADFAGAPFRVQSNGKAFIHGLTVYDEDGDEQLSIGNTAEPGRFRIGSTAIVQVDSDAFDVVSAGPYRHYLNGGTATQGGNLQFWGGGAPGSATRLGYVGYASNDDLRLWNEASAGLIYMATDSTERLRIHADGRMAFNNTLTGDIHYDFWGGYDNIATLRVWNRTGVGDTPRGIDVYLGLNNSSNPGNGDTFVRFRRGDGNVRGSIDGNGASGVRFNTSSDRALKENISKDLSEGVKAFDQIPWRTYVWKGDGRPGVGVVAQQLAKVPRWASSVAKGGTDWEVDPETGKKKRVRTDWGVDYVPFIGAIAAKLVDVDRRLRTLEAKD